jgi:hypothetical protein
MIVYSSVDRMAKILFLMACSIAHRIKVLPEYIHKRESSMKQFYVHENYLYLLI